MSKLSEEIQKQVATYADKMKRLDFQVDTISNSTAGGYFLAGNNSVTLNYHEDNEYLRNWVKTSEKEILYHEEKHRSNAQKGLDNYGLSLEQYYKICMVDEVSANMATLVYLREQYLKTGNINVFDGDNGRFEFYKQAVKSGDINPKSLDAKDFDKDMSLIMNGTKDMWMDEFAKSYDESAHVNMTRNYYKAVGDKAKKNDANYQKCLDIAFTIGGVNFSKYLNKDIECINPSIIEADQQLSKGQKPIFQKIPERIPSYPYNDKLSFAQYNNLLQHKYIAEGLKNLKCLDLDYISKLPPNDKKDAQKFFSTYFHDIKEELREKSRPSNVQEMVRLAVGKDGERLTIPQGDSKEYLAELDKIYTVNGFNLRKFLDVDPNLKMPVELSAEAKNFEKKSFFQRFKQSAVQWGRNVTDKVSGLFADKKTEEINNDGVIIPINNKAPQYDKWSKDKRVSEVQHLDVLDLDKDIIKKPLDNQRDETSSIKAKKFGIGLKQITSSYNTQELRNLCSDEARWNQGRSCNAQQYSHAAEVTGVPAELIAYLYEVNRKNFPNEAKIADDVINGAKSGDLEVAQKVASVLGKYDIERGSFFALREAPRQISVNENSTSKIHELLQRRQSPNPTIDNNCSFRQLRGLESGIAKHVYRKSTLNINNIKQCYVNG